MREKKYSEIIHDALNFLDDEMIEEVDRLRGGVSVESVSTQPQMQDENEKIIEFASKKQRPWRKWVALAASICLLVVLGNVVELNLHKQPIFQQGDTNIGQEEHDALEGDVSDVIGNADTGLGKDDNYGVSDADKNLSDFSNPQTTDQAPIKEIMNLQSYSAVIYLDKPATDFAETTVDNLSEEVCEILDKFLDSAQRGKVVLVDASTWTQAVENAEGHLYFELENGKNAHLVLLGDGTICNYDTKTAWIQMDKRVYRLLIDALKAK